ncbi:MAG: hypothetical protein ABI577_17730, partial [bacterium]
MRSRTQRTRVLMVGGGAIGVFALLSSACMQYPDGTVATPASGGQTEGSRLPQLLSQLQGAGAGIELLDGSQQQVLAAQDAQGKEAPSETATVAGEKTPGSTTTPAGTPTRAGTPTKTPTPTRTVTQAPEGGTTPTAVPSATATPSPTSTPTPTATSTSTP